MEQRIYELTEVVVPPTQGYLRPATQADVDIASRWAWEFQIEAIGPTSEDDVRKMTQRRINEQSLYFWEDGQPVSMAANVRETAHTSTISLVYTPPAARRRGYAMACVAALSQLMLDRGKQSCLLFTNLSNPTSNSIYQQIGYTPVADVNEYLIVAE